MITLRFSWPLIPALYAHPSLAGESVMAMALGFGAAACLGKGHLIAAALALPVILLAARRERGAEEETL